MKKIPTLFERQGKFVVPTLNPLAEWVLFEESVAKRKYDGTCTYFDGENWFTRLAVPNKLIYDSYIPYVDFTPVEFDPATNKHFGWIDYKESSFVEYMHEALQKSPVYGGQRFEDTYYVPGTYELIGPKINGNPEKYPHHRLISHDRAEQLSDINLLELHQLTEEEAFQRLATVLAYMEVEGVVFYGPDDKLAKIKKKDFDYATTKSHDKAVSSMP